MGGTVHDDFSAPTPPSPAHFRPGRAAAAVLSAALAAGVAVGAAPERPSAADAATTTSTRDEVTSPTSGRTVIHLPALDYLYDDPDCSSIIAVQNVGDAPAQAALIAWPDVSEVGGDCVAPLEAVACTGLIRPGRTWQISGAQVFFGSRSAIVFSLSTRRLSEIGVTAGPDRPVADAVCAILQRAVAGDCAGYARFRAAWDAGEGFEGVPLGAAAGEPLAVHVLRRCAGTDAPEDDQASYTGLAGNTLGPATAPGGGIDTGPFAYVAAPVAGSVAGRAGVVHVQNAGARPATVQVRYRAVDACDPWQTCATLRVDPGASVGIAAPTCTSPFADAMVRLESDQPLAVVVDTLGAGIATFSGAPAGSGGRAPGANTPAAASPDGLVATSLFYPLRFDPQAAWDTAVTIVNHAPARPARVRVDFLDRGGQPVDSNTVDICADAVRTVTLALTGALSQAPAGGIRVTSLPTGAPGEAPAAPAQISAVVIADRYDDEGRSARLQTFGDNFQPVARDGAAGAATNDGVRAVALPLVARDLDRTGLSSEIVIANRAPGPGWADVAIVVLDHNAPLRTLCRRLAAGQVDYTSLTLHTFAVHSGVIGSAIVAAAPGFGTAGTGTAAPGSVDLAAAVVTRVGIVFGEDGLGDEVAVAAGAPLAAVPAALVDALALCRGETSPPPPTSTPPAPVPTDVPLPGADVVLLPVLGVDADGDFCPAAVIVTNAGATPAQAVVVVQEMASSCPPSCFGTVEVLCSGLIAPGADWTIAAADFSNEPASAEVYSFNTRTLADLGLAAGGATAVADAVCAQLKEGLAEECDVLHRFRRAYRAGEPFAGIPLGGARGPRLEASVTRTVPAPTGPRGADTVTPSHAGIHLGNIAATGTQIGIDAFHLAAPLHNMGRQNGGGSMIYVQNAGVACATVSLAFRASGDCGNTQVCHIADIAPGGMIPFRATGCIHPDFQGSVVIASSQPLAVVFDTFVRGRGTIVTRGVYPGDQPYDVDGDGRADDADDVAILAASGARPGMPRWDPRLDLTLDDVVDAKDRDVLLLNRCRWVVPPAVAAPSPARPPRGQVHLPTLISGLAACDTAVAMQNVGDEPAVAALVLWPLAAAGAPRCAPPMRVECSGLIRPNGTWNWVDTSGPGGRPGGGVVFAFSARTFEEAGIGGGAGVIGDALCGKLRSTAGGDCTAYRRFRAAYDAGASYDGIPLDRIGGGPVAAHVRLACVDITREPLLGTAYEGIDDTEIGALDPRTGGYSYFTPMVFSGAGDTHTRFFIQNVGLDTAPIEPFFQVPGECRGGSACAPVILQPGASIVYDAARCVGQDWSGSAWFRSPQPLAIVAEVISRPQQPQAFHYVAVPSWRGIDATPTPASPADDPGASTSPSIDHVAYGPLLPDPARMWDTGVSVQNLSMVDSALIQVVFVDAAGTPFNIQDQIVCAGDARTFFLPLTPGGGPAPDAGSMRVVSYALEAGASPPPIAAVAGMFRFSGPARELLVDQMGYNLVPEDEGFRWPVGAGAGGVESGTAVIALPDVADAPDRGDTTDIVVNNLVAVPGKTEVDITLLGDDGAIGTIRRTLGAGQTIVVDMSSVRATAEVPLPAEFRGSAIVSATYWDHAVASPGGGRRTLVGLAAAVVRRDGDPSPNSAMNVRSSVAVGVPVRRASGGGAPPRPTPTEPTGWTALLPYAAKEP